MVRLTAALISAIQNGADITTITSLILPRRNLDQLVGLEGCQKLTRLDLSDNHLPTLEGITFCTQLQWLSVAGNQLTSLKGVESLTKLTVLNASRNELTSFNKVTDLKELRALILNDNKITKVCRLDRLLNLNTLVLSRNPIQKLGKFTSKLHALKKLSLSHCQVQVIGTSLKSNVALEELRLAHNQLSSLPQELEKNGRLTILDIGTNHLKSWSDLQVLGTLSSLVNLNLRGNPLCSENNYNEQVTRRLPYLQILDGHSSQRNHKVKGQKSETKDMRKILDTGDEDTVDEESTQKYTEKSKQKTKGDDSDDRPFLDLISMPDEDPSAESGPEEVTGIKVKPVGKSKKRKDDSGVVSVFNVGHAARKGRASGVKSRKVQLPTQGLEVGMGGPSTWDEPSSDVQVQNTATTQVADESVKKPHSRRALQKKI